MVTSKNNTPWSKTNWVNSWNNNKLKIAWIHDRIFHLGWAESIFLELLEKKIENTDAELKIFTLFSDKKTLKIAGKAVPVIVALPRRINTIFVRGSKKNISVLDYRNLIAISPLLCSLLRRKVRKYDPELSVISSFAFAKNVAPIPWKTELYLHSPNQYIWWNHNEYEKKITGRKGTIFNTIVWSLRRRDAQSRQYDKIMTNSEYTKTQAQTLYQGFDKAVVKYPTIDPAFANVSMPRMKKNYFIFVWRLTSYVRELEKIITVFNNTGYQLIIAWSGPDELTLKALAGPTITFVWNISDVHEKISLMKSARWFINLAKESCGIATMEAIALWLPVFWYNDGGTVELTKNHPSVLIDHKDQGTIQKWFEEFIKLIENG